MTNAEHPFPSVWPELQADWGYPTIIGAQDELYHWAQGLEDLAARLEETVDFLDRDLDRAERVKLPGDVAYSQQQIFLVRTASKMLEQASGLSLARFST